MLIKACRLINNRELIRMKWIPNQGGGHRFLIFVVVYLDILVGMHE